MPLHRLQTQAAVCAEIVLQAVSQSLLAGKPADRCLKDAFYANRQLGSRDRRLIGETLFGFTLVGLAAASAGTASLCRCLGKTPGLSEEIPAALVSGSGRRLAFGIPRGSATGSACLGRSTRTRRPGIELYFEGCFLAGEMAQPYTAVLSCKEPKR